MRSSNLQVSSLSLPHRLPLVLGLLFTLALLGCGDQTKMGFLPNARPIVRLTSAPVDTSEVTFYSIILNWVGFDPDGRVAHFLYAVDPPSGPGEDTLWVKTTDNEKHLVFRASQPDWHNPDQRARDPHVFVIKAIDNHGLASPPVFRAFFSYTIAPTVTLLSPSPSALVTWNLPPSVRFVWSGRDEDGVFSDEPVKYKYTLLGPSSEFTPEQAVANIREFRDFYAPAFASWDSTSPDTTEVIFTNLTPDETYLFAVVAFDEAGAYSPIFSLTNNMVRLHVGFAGADGPKITLFNESFNFTYASGTYRLDERLEVFIEIPAGQPVTFNWNAVAAFGAYVKAYRWALDIGDVSDDTPRDDPNTDVTRWSAASLNVNSATVGPFRGGEEHRFYVEAEDNVGLKSLGVIRFLVVQPSLEKDLGIVDDTRYGPDQLNALTGCSYAPAGFWPTAAEFDTFLYGRGGVPWRCYPFNGQPEPASPRGLFAGYDFDTLNTRTGGFEGASSLSTLGRYRHLIWLNDPHSASNTNNPTHHTNPTTLLRYMTGPSRFNSLSAYARYGGDLWLAGGGVANASTVSWNDRENDVGGLVFANHGPRPELIPGRFMYDLPHWQSTILVRQSSARPTRFTGRFGDSASVTRSGKYAGLPPILERKDPASEPQSIYAPTRPANTYYQSLFVYEFLFKPLQVIEDLSSHADMIDEQSTLDTLYRAVGQGLPSPITNPHNVIMTYYHGSPSRNAKILFSGFTLWQYNRLHLEQLVDFVLQDLWGLSKAPPPPPVHAAATRVANEQPVGSHGVSSPGPSPGGVERVRVTKDAEVLRKPSRHSPN